MRERELEIKAMEERLARRELHCPVCRAHVEDSYLVCPVLHDEAAASVRELQGAAGDALAGLPLLRDARRDADHDRVPSRAAAGRPSG